MNCNEWLCHHHFTQMAIMETMIIYKWIQLWVCYSHTSSGSVVSPAHLFSPLKANKMLLTAPQLLIKYTFHTGKYKQMTTAQEGAAGGDNSGLWLAKSMGISCRIRKCKYNDKMPQRGHNYYSQLAEPDKKSHYECIQSSSDKEKQSLLQPILGRLLSQSDM